MKFYFEVTRWGGGLPKVLFAVVGAQYIWNKVVKVV